MLGQLVRFGLSGVANTIIDFSIFNLLVHLFSVQSGFPLALINTVAVSAAAVNSYLLNRNWTFNSPNRNPSQVIRFIAATLAGLLLNSLVVTMAGGLVGMWSLPAYVVLNGGKILASIVSATFNFFAYRSWVFPSAQHCSPTAADFQPLIPNLVSIIIPAYNESQRLPARIRHLGNLLPNRFPVEIIVVDDGSTDDTLQIAEHLAVQYPCLKLLGYSPNQGKGKAVQTGMLSARGEFVIYTDADDTFAAEHIQQVVDELRSGQEIVIACRKRQGRNRLQGESILRQVMGRVFNGWVQFLLLPGMDDTQCGLKGFQRNVLQELFPRQTVRRFAFDVEILALARALGFGIKPLPIAAIDCSGSQVNCLTAPVQMFWDVIKLKINLLTNRYALPDGYQPLQQLALISGLFAAALMVRIPWLWEIPRFIDELKEVQLGYQIYSGEVLPLTNVAQDIGSLHNFILAALFKIFGPSIYLPRLYVAVTAAATVVLSYYLTRQLFGHRAGIIAAGLLMTNGMHILVTHMAWSNCTTPFFFILAVMAVITAEKYRSGSWLVVSGFLWALTLQTHSSMIIFLAITLIYIVRPRFRLRSGIAPGYYAGAAAALMIGYWNMIYFNFVTRGGSFYWLKHKSYAMENEMNLVNYFENLKNLTVQLIRSVGSVYTAYDQVLLYLLHPAFLLVLALLVSGFIYCLRMKYSALLLWLLVGGALTIPIFNQRYDFYISTRYIMPLIILSIMLISLAAVQWVEQIKNWRISFPAIQLMAALTVFVIVVQLFPLFHYYGRVADSNASNQVALSILNRAENPSSGGPTTVIIDEELQLENEPLPYLFTMTRQPFQMLAAGHDLTDQWRQCLSESKTATLVAVLNEETFSQLRDSMAAARISCLKARVLIPKPSGAERKIYIVEIDREPPAKMVSK